MVVLVLLSWLVPAVQGAGTLHTIVSNGPPLTRFNVVLLSEGYTAAQLPQFRVDATNAINTLFASEPYREYRSYFNAFAIAIASVQSGSDHPSQGVSSNTYFNSSYDASDRLITIPSGSTGQGKVDTLLNAHVPAWDLSVMLVNDPTEGGSDGGARTAISSVSGIPYILTHETGHVVANLGDEYTFPNPGYPAIEEPNTTRETNRASIKWKAWIAPETPVPTPPSDDYQDAVGLFEGAHYNATGWYRPKLNCTMQNQYTPGFCEVCREALLLAFYGDVRPVLATAPASQVLNVTSNSLMDFTLTLLQPLSHDLAVQWHLNGTSIPGATNSTFVLSPATVPNGTNHLAAIVFDPTPFVRTDPSGLLRQTNVWTLRVDLPAAPPELRLSQAESLPDGSISFTVTGNVSQACVEAASNLTAWVTLTTNALLNGAFIHTNAVSTMPGGWFFRARTVP